MRYRLRTLLIVVTAICVLMALIARDGGYWLSIRIGGVLLLLSPFAPFAEMLFEWWVKQRRDDK